MTDERRGYVAALRARGPVVHALSGAVGGDWAVDDAVATVLAAHDVAWEAGGPDGHELRVELRDGPRVRLLHFDVAAPEWAQAWMTAFRPEGFGKAHAALEGQTRARCGVPVRPARGGALGQPFRPGASRCAGCSRLVTDDEARGRSAGQPGFTG